MSKISSQRYEEIYERPYHVEWLGKYKGYEVQIRLATELAKGSRILDIGCGEGVITSRLHGKKVVGVDISKNALRYGKKNYGYKKVEFVLASANKLPFKGASFDCVTAFELIEHLTPEDMHKCLSEMSRACESDGRIIISTPNLSSIYYATLKSVGIKHKGHVNEMSFVELINILSAYFTIIEIRHNIETPWLKTLWLTNLTSRIQKMLLKIFPPMEYLFYSQIYLIMRNKPSKAPDKCNHGQK